MKHIIKAISAALAALLLTAVLAGCSLAEALAEPVMTIVSEILSDGAAPETVFPSGYEPETVRPDGPDEPDAPSGVNTPFPDDGELLAQFRGLFEAWQSVEDELFGLDVDWDTPYLRLYATEDAANRFVQEPPVKLALWSDFSVVSTADMQTDEGLWIDGAMASLYPVSGVSDVSEVYDRLALSLDESLFADRLEYDLVQFDGVVYMVRGGRGYGGGKFDPESAVVTVSSGTTREVTLYGEWFSQPVFAKLTLAHRDDGRLIITEADVIVDEGEEDVASDSEEAAG